MPASKGLYSHGFSPGYRYNLLDEPTTYLDINHQLEILEIIKILKDGKTIVMVLHDLNSALSTSDRVCLRIRGR